MFAVARLAAPCEPPLTPHAATGAPLVVLDTNVVLDWLLFEDAAVRPLADAVAARRLRWLATPAMRDELAHVLARGLAAARGADAQAVLRGWDSHAELRSEPAGARAAPVGAALRCSDPDDQKFIDLALACGARWLVSRDRAVLKLARRAAAGGLAIVTPGRWQALQACDPMATPPATPGSPLGTATPA